MSIVEFKPIYKPLLSNCLTTMRNKNGLYRQCNKALWGRFYSCFLYESWEKLKIPNNINTLKHNSAVNQNFPKQNHNYKTYSPIFLTQTPDRASWPITPRSCSWLAASAGAPHFIFKACAVTLQQPRLTRPALSE